MDNSPHTIIRPLTHQHYIQQNRQIFTNYKKADLTQFTEDKHNIPKGNMHSNCMLLPNYIVCKITQRNNMRRENTCDPALITLREKTDYKPMIMNIR